METLMSAFIAILCVGLITSGEHWMLVDAPRDDTSGFTSWYAELPKRGSQIPTYQAPLSASHALRRA